MQTKQVYFASYGDGMVCIISQIVKKKKAGRRGNVISLKAEDREFILSSFRFGILSMLHVSCSCSQPSPQELVRYFSFPFFLFCWNRLTISSKATAAIATAVAAKAVAAAFLLSSLFLFASLPFTLAKRLHIPVSDRERYHTYIRVQFTQILSKKKLQQHFLI